jgi:hypothetical protein
LKLRELKSLGGNFGNMLERLYKKLIEISDFQQISIYNQPLFSFFIVRQDFMYFTSESL